MLQLLQELPQLEKGSEHARKSTTKTSTAQRFVHGCCGPTFSWSVKMISRPAFSPEGSVWVTVRLIRLAPGAASSFPTGPACSVTLT